MLHCCATATCVAHPCVWYNCAHKQMCHTCVVWTLECHTSFTKPVWHRCILKAKKTPKVISQGTLYLFTICHNTMMIYILFWHTCLCTSVAHQLHSCGHLCGHSYYTGFTFWCCKGVWAQLWHTSVTFTCVGMWAAGV